MLGGADNPNGELPSYITGADIVADASSLVRSDAVQCIVIDAAALPGWQRYHKLLGATGRDFNAVVEEGTTVPFNMIQAIFGFHFCHYCLFCLLALCQCKR
ncbi:hypothetical protein EHF41_07740 [Salmonella enterica subsp. diarizonae serovar 61:k:1,5,(7)]|nr:hypothetical protein EHF41_07740 [Salmonella enterica subsp. diarizonae serovar 61:k:1,5,(7)]